MNMNKKRKTVGNCGGKDGNEEKVFPPVQEIKKMRKLRQISNSEQSSPS